MLASAGLVAGVFLAMAASRLVSGLLFGIQPTDAVTYVAVVAALALVTMAAAAIPAWRATTIDPLSALREE
jgi:ABC-type antimicrobial peptide transport system permease subunit